MCLGCGRGLEEMEELEEALEEELEWLKGKEELDEVLEEELE